MIARNETPNPSLEIDTLVCQYLTRKQTGEALEMEAFARQFPEFEKELLKVLPTVDLLENGKKTERSNHIALKNLPENLKKDYEIVRLIGQGGMGVVYEAEHLLRSTVALKVMLPDRAKSDRRRFIREASISAKLHHPNIVPVFEIGEAGDLLYLSMKKIDGPDLREVLERRNSQRCTKSKRSIQIAEKLDGNWPMVAKIGFQVATALEYAHRHGVLHRDIKPANLILDAEENIWITDFGLAKMKSVHSSLTRSDNAVGTLRYMAPEQIDNICDERTDIFSLGVTLYEMTRGLNGRFSVLSSRHPLKKPSDKNSSIPKGLEDAILKACQPDPEDRFQSAGEFARELARYCDRRKKPRTPLLKLSSIAQLACVILLATLLSLGFFKAKPPTLNVVNTIRETPVVPVNHHQAMQSFDVNTGITTLRTQIAHQVDDAEEWLRGKMYLRSSDLEFTWDEGEQQIGLIFRYCGIPRNATIQNAYISNSRPNAVTSGKPI